MKLEIEINETQAKEFAKMLFLAQFVVDSSGKYSKSYKYPLIEEHLETLRILNRSILLAFPNIELLEVNEKLDKKYSHNIAMELATKDLLNTHFKVCLNEEVATAITKKEFAEKYPNLDSEAYEIIIALYHNNLKWIEENGIGSLIIPEK